MSASSCKQQSEKKDVKVPFNKRKQEFSIKYRGESLETGLNKLGL